MNECYQEAFRRLIKLGCDSTINLILLEEVPHKEFLKIFTSDSSRKNSLHEHSKSLEIAT